MSSPDFRHTYKLNSAASVLQIPHDNKLDNIRAIRIDKIQYTTGTANNLLLLIDIPIFNSASYFHSESSIVDYTDSLPLSTSSGVLSVSDVYKDYRHFEVKDCSGRRKEVNSFSVNCWILKTTGAPALVADITSSNPVIIEVSYYK